MRLAEKRRGREMDEKRPISPTAATSQLGSLTKYGTSTMSDSHNVFSFTRSETLTFLGSHGQRRYNSVTGWIL
ncbi:hypothetical protein RRG08_059373 [Elysia crispata]|uniref:Uncharacterized protein n=1 Tax=Elysia crispata TaxID=231223 RepID=A0AAE1EGR4_9GAST|nr:hypothetical protein RRG08_059373 [Elysia crispata]